MTRLISETELIYLSLKNVTRFCGQQRAFNNLRFIRALHHVLFCFEIAIVPLKSKLKEVILFQII